MPEETSVEQKALRINMEGRRHGTFAEIGAGQEVARWFFHVGNARATVAKTISAYDMAISDSIYGTTEHYVSRQRLEAMLDHEFERLVTRLDATHGEKTAFFVFADTSATSTHSQRPAGHSWLGVRFQTEPRTDPSEIIIHVEMLDPVTLAQQEAVGLAGVNLLYGAFYHAGDPSQLIGTLMHGLSRRRIEVDMIKFSGPAFGGVDNRLMSLQLVEQGLTDAAMFMATGEVVQPAEVLYNKRVLVERGSFRPVTNVTLDMLNQAARDLPKDSPPTEPVAIMEMTLNNLISERVIDHEDFLARVDILGALGKTVMISNYTTFDRVTMYLRQYTKNWIGVVVGVPTLREIFEAKYYADREGGILEGLGRLFQGCVKVFVYPTKADDTGEITNASNVVLKPELTHLYQFLTSNGYVESMQALDSSELQFTPALILAKIQAGDPVWETLVPPQAAELIKQKALFGWQHSSS